MVYFSDQLFFFFFFVVKDDNVNYLADTLNFDYIKQFKAFDFLLTFFIGKHVHGYTVLTPYKIKNRNGDVYIYVLIYVHCMNEQPNVY